MRKTVYVILVLCCFIIKTYSINRPYYHFKQLSIKEGLPTSIISLYDDKNGSDRKSTRLNSSHAL